MPANEPENTYPEVFDRRKKLAEELASDHCGASFDDAMQLLTTLANDHRPDVRLSAIHSLRSRCAHAELDECEIEAIVYPIVSRGFDSAASEQQLACLSLLKAAEINRRHCRNVNPSAPKADVKWAMPYLFGFIDRGDELLRAETVDLLWVFGQEDLQTGETFFVPGTDPNKSLRSQVRRLFSDLPNSPDEIVNVRDFLRNRDQQFRRLGLIAAGWNGRALLAEVITLLDDPVLEVRLAAIAASERIGPDALPGLVEYSERLSRLVSAVGEGDISSQAVGPAGTSKETGASEEVALSVAYAIATIGRMGASSAAAFSVVTEGLRSRDARVCAASIGAWTQIGPSTGQVLRDVIEYLNDPDVRVVDAADCAIRRLIGDGVGANCPQKLKDSIQALDGALKESDAPRRLYTYLVPYVSQIAARQDLGELISGATETIAFALESTDETIQECALCAIAEFGVQANTLVPGVLKVIARAIDGHSSTDPGPRLFFAWRALRSIGTEAVGALPQLMDLLKSRSPSIRLDAALSITYIDPHQSDALNLLKELRDESEECGHHQAVARLRELAGQASRGLEDPT
jgi:hypothetical protein